MRCKFPERDLAQRLDATICRFRGLPVYVRVTGRGLTLYSLPSGGKKALYEIRADDPEFDISTIPLGYVQIAPDIVVYTSRRPQRLYKQGLASESISWKFTNNNNNHRVPINFFNVAFENMVLGAYPDLRDALHILRKSDTEKEVAISRDIALKYNPNLKIISVYFKGEDAEVGWIVPDTNIVIVPSSEKGWIVSQNLVGFSWEIR